MRFPTSWTVHGNMPFAEEELRRCLAECLGSREANGGYPISVFAANGEEETFRVIVTEQGTRIESASPRGAVFGVYAFLERQLGCRFFAPDCERLPFSPQVELALGEYASSPDFAYREVYWRGALNGRFALQCGLNSARADIAPEMGGKTMFYNYSHSFEELVPPEKWFDAHPEYFSQVDGVRLRHHGQLCLTNPEVLALCVEGVKGWIKGHPECRVFSVAQNDWYGNCACEACREVDEREGSAAGTMIAFVNAIGDAIREEYPKVMLHTFAYLFSRKPPRTLRPRDNVIVRLCSIECCYSHPIGACGHAIAAIDVEEGSSREFAPCVHSFEEDLREWAEIAPHLYIWDYTTNFSNYLQPFPNSHVLAPNLRLFKKYGVEGVFEQGNYAPGETSAFGPLKIYLLGKLLWNVSADVEGLIAEFLVGYYGSPAAGIMGKCLAALETMGKNHHMGIFDPPSAPYLDETVLTHCDALFCEAIHRAREEIHRERIRRERLSVTYALLARMPLNAPDREERIDVLQREAEELGISEIFERRELKASFDCLRKSRYARERKDVPYTFYRL